MPSTSSAIAVGWSPFGLVFGLDDEAHAAFGFFPGAADGAASRS